MTTPKRLTNHKIQTEEDGTREILGLKETLEQWAQRRPDLHNLCVVADALKLNEVKRWQFVSLALIERIIATETRHQNGNNTKTAGDLGYTSI